MNVGSAPDDVGPVRAVMFFAEDPALCCGWWADILGVPVEGRHGSSEFSWFDHRGVEVGFHPADEVKNLVGGSPVVYWSVDHLDRVKDRLLAAGCRPHRGPIRIEPGRSICQLLDPFGNVVGLDGP